MRYGRSHEEREQKIYSRAKINVHGTLAHSDLMPPVSPKSNTAPTARAVERERLRHQEERKLGRTAAGTHGVLRDQRAGVSREALTEAAHTADTRLERRSHRPPGKT